MRSLHPITKLLSWLQIILPVFLSAFTAWLVIRVFIKCIFWPIHPVKIAGIKIQGFIPGQQHAMAEKIGKLVSKELISFADVEQKITDPENFNKLKPEIETHIDSFLRERLKDTFPMLSMLIGDKTINQLKTAFMLELESLFPVLMKSYITRLENDLEIEKTVTQKISAISMEKTEKIFYATAKKQLINIQLTAVLIGLIMGLLHLLINIKFYT